MIRLAAALLLLIPLPSPSATESVSADPQAAAPPPDETPLPVPALAVPVPEGLTGQHLVVADDDGRVFLFHGPTLTAYPVSRHGELGRPVALEPLADLASASPVMEAAVSASGRRWLVRHFGGPRRVRLFEGGEEVLLPAPPWRAAAIGFAGETPIALVAPLSPGHELGGGPEGRPPLLMRYHGSQWHDWVAPASDLGIEEIKAVPVHRRRDIQLVPAERRHLWLMPRYRYRVEELSSGGRRLTVLQRGDGEFERRELSGEQIEERVAALEAAREKGMAVPKEIIEAAGARTHRVARQLEAAAFGRDGMLYLLLPPDAEAGGHPTLHRYDPVRAVVEATPVAIAPYSGLRTMVAGEQGLLIANAKAGSGLWTVSWEALREATWHEVPEVSVGSSGD